MNITLDVGFRTSRLYPTPTLRRELIWKTPVVDVTARTGSLDLSVSPDGSVTTETCEGGVGWHFRTKTSLYWMWPGGSRIKGKEIFPELGIRLVSSIFQVPSKNFQSPWVIAFLKVQGASVTVVDDDPDTYICRLIFRDVCSTPSSFTSPRDDPLLGSRRTLVPLRPRDGRDAGVDRTGWKGWSTTFSKSNVNLNPWPNRFIKTPEKKMLTHKT